MQNLISKILNLIWYEGEMVFSNNYYKCVDDILNNKEGNQLQGGF